MVTLQNLELRYSGGSFNIDPNLSIGGLISETPISSGKLNNLFGKLTDRDPNSPYYDYRAIYVLNNSFTDSFYDLKLSISDQIEGGASILIGTVLRNEKQTVQITNVTGVTNGLFTLKFKNSNIEIEWDSLENVRSQLEERLNETSGHGGIIVDYEVSDSDTAFFGISFEGYEKNRLQQKIEVVSNDLTSITNSDIAVSRDVYGSPINDIATDIAFSNAFPYGITFNNAEYNIGRLGPQESFFLWIERSVDIMADTSILDDGFALKIKAKTGF